MGPFSSKEQTKYKCFDIQKKISFLLTWCFGEIALLLQMHKDSANVRTHFSKIVLGKIKRRRPLRAKIFRNHVLKGTLNFFNILPIVETFYFFRENSATFN